MFNFKRMSLAKQFSVLVIVVLVGTACIKAVYYFYNETNSSISEQVEEARGIIMMAESVREQVNNKWELGVYTPDKLKKAVKKADTESEKKELILDAVPISNAWHVAQRKSQELGFTFKPLRKDPRNEAHAPDKEVELKALDYFKNNPQANNYYQVSEEENTIRYFRPIHLDENCLICHGDPDRSQELWGRDDGRDIAGYKMEGWNEGDMTGAFEVIMPLDEALADRNQNVIFFVVITLGGIFIGVGIVLYFANKYITRPLGDVISDMQAIENGDFSKTLNEDERGEISTLNKSINAMAAKIGQIIENVSQYANQLGSSSEELSTSAEEISSNVSDASSNVDNVAGSAQEVNNVVHDVANNISGVSDKASQSSDKTQKGMEVVEGTKTQMSELESTVDQVDQLMESIQSIAKKTDLLALNAAIEAANAGEAGKGFAVVADEVRKLAEQTSNASQDVTTIVQKIKTNANDTSSSMEEVSSSMEEIQADVQETDHLASQIAAAAEQLAATMSETTENLGEVNQYTDSVADSVTEVQDAATKLHELAINLTSEVDVFNKGSTLQFSKAKSDHKAWKTKLREFLKGKESLNEQELKDHTQCNLGKWITNEGKANFSHMSEFRQLEEVHKSLHQSIKKVVELKNSGKEDQADREYQGNFEHLSNQVIELLTQMEKKS